MLIKKHKKSQLTIPIYIFIGFAILAIIIKLIEIIKNLF